MTLPHDLHEGTDVFSSDGKKLGNLHRVVISRRTLRPTHIVIDVGFLRSGHHLWEGGLALEYDRVIPIEDVKTASDSRVELGLSAADFAKEPEYTDEHFEQPHDLTPNQFDISDVIQMGERLGGGIPGGFPSIWIATKLRKSKDETDIEEGTPVWRQEPHEKLGEVDRILIDSETGRVQGLVIKRGFLLKRDVVLPIRYVSELLDDMVHVEISDEELAQLREYNPSGPA